MIITVCSQGVESLKCSANLLVGVTPLGQSSAPSPWLCYTEVRLMSEEHYRYLVNYSLVDFDNDNIPLTVKYDLHCMMPCHCRVPRPSLCSLSWLEDLAWPQLLASVSAISGTQRPPDLVIHQLMCQWRKAIKRRSQRNSFRPLTCFRVWRGRCLVCTAPTASAWVTCSGWCCWGSSSSPPSPSPCSPTPPTSTRGCWGSWWSPSSSSCSPSYADEEETTLFWRHAQGSTSGKWRKALLSSVIHCTLYAVVRG